ncbi:translation initiation factor 2D [Schistosoma bovis]|uniref:Translation initiation factor 2D n=1 Tax=Schistosoma bovis TaxID=6184 RepID=A0A430QS97_SCHBO|nr:translation initiation factor 2D [Schistosoma bovis]
MFLKPFAVRSNSQIKSCEKSELYLFLYLIFIYRKQLLNSFYDQYELDPTNILEIFKTKDVHRLKVITSSEIKVNIYKFGNIPLIIENEKERLPTDLMLPGVVTDGPILPYTFNKIEKGVLCCISTTSNRAPIAIGHTAMSNYDMYMSAGKGKAVSVFHVMGDHVCSLVSSFNRPILPWPIIDESSPKTNEEIDNVDDGSKSPVNILPQQISDDKNISEELNDLYLKEAVELQPSLDLDKILRECFLKGLKLIKANQLPIQVNIFYSQYVLVHKSPSVDLDIRKTKFKKVGLFLKAMQDEGFVEVTEPKSGVLMLNHINKDHIESGECISQSEARRTIDNYVRNNKLQLTTDPSLVHLDKLLTSICEPKTFIESPESTITNPIFHIRFGDLISQALKNLTTAYRIIYPNMSTPVIWNKKEPPHIHLYTVTKAGKKLTRIAELEDFHINPDSFSKQLKVHLACSAGKTDDQQYPGKTVIQAQGVHLVAISKLLTESYSIPKRFIKGYTEPDKKK